MTDEQPLSALDQCCDELCFALARLPNLPQFIADMRQYEEIARELSMDSPVTTPFLAGTQVRRALTNIAVEVNNLRTKDR